MSELTLDDLVRDLQDLPSLPAVVMELLSSIDQEDVDISVLAKKVSHDAALTAKTLRLANSSLYGLQVKVTTIQQAITFLGFQTTRNLITAAAVTGCFAEGHARIDIGSSGIRIHARQSGEHDRKQDTARCRHQPTEDAVQAVRSERGRQQEHTRADHVADDQREAHPEAQTARPRWLGVTHAVSPERPNGRP